MKLSELKAVLRAHPEAHPRFVLPDGGEIPAHFHITEVGHVAKRFIDCGGKLHDTSETCLLQTHVGQRCRASPAMRHRFAQILELGGKVLPSDDVEVEVEYDGGVMTQHPIAGAHFTGTHLELQLGKKHTACLARERAPESSCGCC